VTTRERREWLLIAGGFGAIALAAGLWLAVDRRPPAWDHANHLERAVLCAQDIGRGDVRAILERSSFYPPLVPCLAGLAYRLAPTDVMAAQAVVLLFLGLGMAATYLLGRRLVDGTAGVVAALLFASAPFVLFSTLQFQLDLPLAAMVALTVYAALESDGFERRGWSVATGMLVGLGLVTKPPFVAYVVVPLVVVAAGVRNLRRAVHALVATVLAIALSLPWYGPRLVAFPMQVGNRSFKQAAEAGAPDPATWAGLSFYPRWSATQFGLVGVLLFVVGLIVAVRQRRWLALAALLVPVVALEAIQNKNLRYTLPLLPLTAVIAGMGFSALPRRGRWIAATAMAGAVLLQASGTFLGIPWPRTVPGLGVPWAIASPPDRANWRHREILALIARHGGNRGLTVSVVPNVPAFSMSNFQYYAVRDDLRFRFVRAWDDPPLGIAYMIVKTGDQGPSWTAEKPRRIGERLARDTDLARVFPSIGEFPLPDGSTATVRARAVPGVAGTTPRAVADAVGDALRRRLGDVARDVDRLGVTLDYDDTILSGHIGRLEITARSATLGDFTRRAPATLTVHDLRVIVEAALVNPFSARFAGRFDPLDVGRLSIPSATVTGPDLQKFLQADKGFQHASVTLADGALEFALRGALPTLRARIRILPASDRPFRIDAERVSIGGIPLPSLLVEWVVRNFDPSPRLAARLPFPVALGSVTVERDAVRITPAGLAAAR
jgi:hypothetical protein